MRLACGFLLLLTADPVLAAVDDQSARAFQLGSCQQLAQSLSMAANSYSRLFFGLPSMPEGQKLTIEDLDGVPAIEELARALSSVETNLQAFVFVSPDAVIKRVQGESSIMNSLDVADHIPGAYHYYSLIEIVTDPTRSKDRADMLSVITAKAQAVEGDYLLLREICRSAFLSNGGA